MQNGSLRSRLKDWIGPNAIAAMRALTGGGVTFKGTYANWADAAARASGYDDALILNCAIEAAAEVEAGQAAFDRDGVAFAAQDDAYPILAALLRVAALDGRLSVLDFGGALGSTWRQHRRWLEGLPEVTWTVVEQRHFVEAGKAQFAGGALRFAVDISQAVSDARPNVVLLGSVLQYIEDAEGLMTAICALSCDTLIIDRIPTMNHAGPAVITVQHTAESIVKSSYPCWIFTDHAIRSLISPEYKLMSRYVCDTGRVRALHQVIRYSGFVFSRLSRSG